MSRRGSAIAAGVAALALGAPQGAAAQSCQAPKAWETAALQLQYDVELELGLTEQHTDQLRRTPGSQMPGAAVVYLGQRVTSAAVLAGAVGRYGTTVLSNPPECAARTQQRRRRAR